MKNHAKNAVAHILGWQVRRLRKRADFQLVAIAGSVGKTSTKFAIASLLETSTRVRWQKGNYNDIVSVPLVFFGLQLPSLFNPFSWLMVFIRIELQLRKPYPYDVVVVELGTDFPGNLAQFKKCIHADIGVLTAIAPEHMTYFEDLDAVAREELTIAELSDKLLVNMDLCDPRYLRTLNRYATYGTHSQADFRLAKASVANDGMRYTIESQGKTILTGLFDGVAVTQLVSLTAAVAVGSMLGLNHSQLERGAQVVKPVQGRMQRLRGIKNTTILDDTYNASPEAVRAALDALYALDAPQKIALLGNMNELGELSATAHQAIGEYCDPSQLELVVTLGVDANRYLAEEAERQGCRVVRTGDPYTAAAEIKKVLKSGALVLAKGSQNGVFAEEAIKHLLADASDRVKLVRQDEYWLRKKAKLWGRHG